MSKYKFAKLANEIESEVITRSKNALSRALEILIRELGLTNGSLKVYVRQGKPSPRLEIQTDISKELEG